MPFHSTNSKPLSTLTSKNILLKENVPKSSLTTSTITKKSTTSTTLATKKVSNTTNVIFSSLKPSATTSTSTLLHEPTKPGTRVSQTSKTSNVTQFSKVADKENTLVERTGLSLSNNNSNRIPLKSIKKPSAPTRSTTLTTVYSQPNHGLKSTSNSSNTSTSIPTKTLSTTLSSRKSSSISLESFPSSNTSLSLSKETFVPPNSNFSSSSSSSSSLTSALSSSTSLLSNSTSLPDTSSSSRASRSVPKKRVKSDEILLSGPLASMTHTTSPIEEEKENQVYPSFTASQYSHSSYSKLDTNVVEDRRASYDDDRESLTSTSRSKKLRTMDELESGSSTVTSLSKLNYKSIHLHSEVIEEQEEEELELQRHSLHTVSEEFTKMKAATLSEEKDAKENKENEQPPQAIHPSSSSSVTAMPYLQQISSVSTTSLEQLHSSQVVPSMNSSKQTLLLSQESKSNLDLDSHPLPPSSMSLSEKLKNFGMLDIDIEDIEEVTLCAEYVHEILEYLTDREKFFMPNPDYISSHPELQWHMRTILVDWLMEVHQKFKFFPETLFLGVNIMDRFLSKRTVSLSKFQLVGLASLFIAAKIEEIFCPPVSDFSFMADSAFNDDDMLRAEQFILKTLTFDVWAPGPFSFIRRISKVDEYNIHHRIAAKFFAEASLLDHRFLIFAPSLIGASAMYLARWIHKAPGPRWNSMFETVSGYSESDLLKCVYTFLSTFSIPADADSFFYKKYSARNYVQLIHEVKELAETVSSRSHSSVFRQSIEESHGSLRHGGEHR